MHSSGVDARKLIVTGGVVLSALLGGATRATAQSAVKDGVSTLGEVVVTAQKREQNLQEVPVAVTSVSQETLQANRVTNIMDLNGLAPGLVARVNAGSVGSPSYAMRGIFASASVPGQDREVSTYIDGVYLGSNRGAVFDLPDIQRVEVLRGPQGTLFGRNATGGAVNIATRDPSGDFKLRQQFSVGNQSQFRSRTSVDLPAWGPLSAYFTYVHDERRGDVRNLGAGTTFDRTGPFTSAGLSSSPKWLGGRSSNNIFLALKFAPTDNFSITYKFDWSREHHTPEARGTTVLNPNDFVGGLLARILAAQPPGGGRFGPVVLTPDKRPDAVNNAWSQEGYVRAQGHNLTMLWSPLENVSVKNITAYRRSSAFGPASLLGLSGLEFTPGAAAALSASFGIPLPFLTPSIGQYFAGYENNVWGSFQQVSNETQVNYESKVVTVTAGAILYHSSERNNDSGMPGTFAFTPVPTLLPLGNVQIGTATTTSLAAYAQGEFHITPDLNVILGGRMTEDRKHGALITGGTFVGARQSGGITGATLVSWQFKKAKPTFSAAVNYEVTPDVLIYGKYSTGFLSGGAVGALSFAPETVKSWEGGLKSEWFDRRLRANLAVWQARYDHLQSAQSGANAGHPELAVVVVDNGANKAKGFELEVTAAPVEGLTLNGSLAYTHGKLLNPSPLVAQGNPNVWTADPPWNGNASAQYVTKPVYQNAYMSFRVDVNYTGKFRSYPNPLTPIQLPVFAPYNFNGSTWLVNARVALRDLKIAGSTAEVALWARNLLDNKDQLYPFGFAAIAHTTSWQPARTFGVDVSVDF